MFLAACFRDSDTDSDNIRARLFKTNDVVS